MCCIIILCVCGVGCGYVLYYFFVCGGDKCTDLEELGVNLYAFLNINHYYIIVKAQLEPEKEPRANSDI